MRSGSDPSRVRDGPPERDDSPGHVFTAARTGVFARISAGLEAAGIGLVHFLVRGEPTTATADDGARFAIASGCELVIGLGGGSVLDAAKAISGLITNGGDILDYLEVVGRGRSLESPAAPLIAIPTTAGTGSEVTKNAVLTETSARVKASIRSPLLLPAVALVDPDLTHSLPPSLTASTGLDALTQLIEAYLTPRANPVTDLFALDGIARSARSLLHALEDGSDAEAREDLALASLFGGFALANAGLGAVHGIAAPLGGRHPVPHGVACAVLLPHVFEANLRALRRADPSSPALARMGRVGEVLMESFRVPGGSLPDELDDPAEYAARLLHFIVSRCRLPGLASYGVTRSDISALVEGALRASSMKGNPIPLTSDELATAISAAL
jgi:alcohol dehydrogenase class IV